MSVLAVHCTILGVVYGNQQFTHNVLNTVKSRAASQHCVCSCVSVQAHNAEQAASGAG